MINWFLDVKWFDDFHTEKCRFCTGTGSVTVELGGDEKEVSRCINCDGAGSLTCTTCQGTGIQPRYLDRRYLNFFTWCILFAVIFVWDELEKSQSMHLLGHGMIDTHV